MTRLRLPIWVLVFLALAWPAARAEDDPARAVTSDNPSAVASVQTMPPGGELNAQILKYRFRPLQNRSGDPLKQSVKSEIVGGARW